jgi:hypothetical protein
LQDKSPREYPPYFEDNLRQAYTTSSIHYLNPAVTKDCLAYVIIWLVFQRVILDPNYISREEKYVIIDTILRPSLLKTDSIKRKTSTESM